MRAQIARRATAGSRSSSCGIRPFTYTSAGARPHRPARTRGGRGRQDLPPCRRHEEGEGEAGADGAAKACCGSLPTSSGVPVICTSIATTGSASSTRHGRVPDELESLAGGNWPRTRGRSGDGRSAQVPAGKTPSSSPSRSDAFRYTRRERTRHAGHGTASARFQLNIPTFPIAGTSTSTRAFRGIAAAADARGS